MDEWMIQLWTPSFATW